MQDVVGLGISSADGLNNRPSPYNLSFYDTQGEAYAISGGAGSFIEMMLYIPSSWADASNGNRRTDVWTVMPISGQPPQNWGDGIAGFTNYDGAARYRVWDNQSGWVDLATPVAYDQWTSFQILFTGDALAYSINGVLVYTDSEPATFTGIASVILNAFNFSDPGLNGAVANDYTAYWADSAVPEPSSAALGAIGLAGLMAWKRWRARRANF